ncbi:hypothetical protein HIM_01212 [Hirsutella minnesotensis 3608]|nr:hypothetical protein HIM_01212 [Hirsutella minnesotensis 3608]
MLVPSAKLSEGSDAGAFLKTGWLANLGRLSYDAPAITEADIEDATTFQPEPEPPIDEDEMMVDDCGEEGGLDTSSVSREQQESAQRQRPPSPGLSDDEYDELFAELILKEQPSQTQSQQATELMDMTDS